MGEKSGNGIFRDVMVFKSCFKYGKKVISIPRVTAAPETAFSWKVSTDVKVDPSVI